MSSAQYAWNSENFRAIAREATLAAEHMAIGVSALGNANYAQNARYPQAFFALSIGFERSCKLAIILDYTITSSGNFPSQDIIRKYGHGLNDLLKTADAISVRHSFSSPYARLPRSQIHQAIINILTDFANNTARYYNLEFMMRNPKQPADPIYSWYETVTKSVLDKHYNQRAKARDERKTQAMEKTLAQISLIRFTSETGDPITSPYEGSLHSAANKFATPYTRMYVMQITRFLAYLVSKLGDKAQQTSTEPIPALSEIFAIFQNNDNYLKNRKTWSIYKP